jgi:molecular chaperone HscC
MTKQIIGIDLGTTFSLAAVLRDGKPTVLPNAVGELLTPSAVSVMDDGTVLVGAPARARLTTHPTATALAFKRDMGTDRKIAIANRTFTPQELSAMVLAQVKRDAEAALGETIDEAVVTVPAYFGDAQRQATRDAGAIAGLTVERIINEPTAAALAYGLHERHREMRAVVVDLGGGTFDVTVLEILEGVVEIQASAGDVRLGGEDFDFALAEVMRERIRRDHGIDVRDDPRAWARIKDASELAKKRLSDADTASIALYELPAGKRKTINVETQITRDDADAAWAPLVERLKLPIARALRDAKLQPTDVEEVLLVGGSTRMPNVAKLCAQLFGRLPLRTLPPDEAVALGAAVQAGLKQGDAALGDMVVTDIAPFSLGVATGSRFGQQIVAGMFTPILERGTVIPVSRVQQFHTLHDNQQHLVLEIYQGEHSLVQDNKKLGEIRIDNLLHSAAGKVNFDVRFTYDMNGILEVDVKRHDTNATQSLVIENAPGRLTPAQIKAAREGMARLKFHPRDALPNATVLARADALHVELTGEAREHLRAAITVFQAALDHQDPERIREVRDALAGLIEQLRRGG